MWRWAAKKAETIQMQVHPPKPGIPRPTGFKLTDLPQTAREWILAHKNSATTHEYRADVEGRKVKLYIVTFSGGGSSKHDALVDNIVTWLHVAARLASQSCGSGQLTGYVYLTQLPKTMPVSDSAPIGHNSVNTGFTESCNRHPSTIVVYRREEALKVFIHETFHALGLDFSTAAPSQAAQQTLHASFAINNQHVALFEVHAEFWARIINLVLISAHTGQPINVVMAIESQFATLQAVKVLERNGLSLATVTGSGDTEYRETTNAFAYYFMVAVLMLHANEYIGSGARPQAPQTDQIQQDLVRLVAEWARSPRTVRAFAKQHSVLQSLAHSGRLARTMRMTCYEAAF
jgi:hypothetical protein